MKLSLLLPLFLIAALPANAQHFIDGTWEGNYKGLLALIGGPRKVTVNLQVSADNVVTGTSHLYYNNKNHYEHYAVKGYYNPEDSTIFFSEDSVISVSTFLDVTTCMGDYKMKLTATDSALRLNGRWFENHKLGSGCGNSGVWFTKTLPKKPVKKEDKNLERVAEVQRLIELDQAERDSIRIELRDNAQVDGDVVSVYFNDSLILDKEKLNATPIVFYISIPEGMGICNLKMAAESLGSVPPCTALMNIATKQMIYEVNLSSSMSNNSLVQFFIKE